MKISKNLKKIFIPLFCAVFMLCTGILALNFNIWNLQEKSVYAATNTPNASVIYADNNSLGKFVDGYVYKYTDSAKYSGFRATPRTQTSDTSTITVNETATHGSQENPYVIASPADWEKFVKMCGRTEANSSGKYFVLANDIDFNPTGTTQIDFHPVAVFSGTFYGCGNSIKNLAITSWQYWNGSAYEDITLQTETGFGTFCYIKNSCITDLVVNNYNMQNIPNVKTSVATSVNRGSFCGAIAGIAFGTTNYILNCHTKGQMSSPSTMVYTVICPSRSGILGATAKDAGTTTIYRCSSNIYAELTSNNAATEAASIAGMLSVNNVNSKAYIYDCASTVGGTITSNASTAYFFAGISSGWSNGVLTTENIVGQLQIEDKSNIKIFSGSISSGSSPVNVITTITNGYADAKVTLNGVDKYSMWPASTNGTAGKNIVTNNISIVNYSSLSANQATGTTTNSTYNKLENTTKLIEAAQTFFGADKYKGIWDTDKIANMADFTPTNNPVRNYDTTKTTVSLNYSKTYDGQEVDFENFYEGITVTPATEKDDLTNARVHKLTVDITNNPNLVFDGLSETERTATITFTINKKQIEVADFKNILADDGSIKEGESITSTTPYITGDSRIPVFGVEYLINGTWTSTLPQNAGDYKVRAYITNPDDCNYELSETGDGETTKTIPKKNVSVPHLILVGEGDSDVSGSKLTVKYNGKTQEFKLVNSSDNSSLSDNVAVTGLNGGIAAKDQLQGIYAAKAVNEYTIDVVLRDKDNYQWSDYKNDSSDKRTITLHITKQDLVVEYDNDTLKNWEKGQRKDIIATVKGIVSNERDEYEDVKLIASYTANGGNPVYVDDRDIVRKDDTITVTINLDTFSTGVNYTVSIGLDPTSSTNNNYTLENDPTTSFDFIITVSTIKSIDVLWTYENVLSSTSTGNVFGEGDSVPYNGQEYIISLDETRLAKGLIATYENKKYTNAGSYTTKVTFTCESGYQIKADVEKTYTLNWSIAPEEFDLYYLAWKDDFTYDGLYHKMEPKDIPTWMTIKAVTSSKYDERSVGKYVASYELGADQNHKFKLSQDKEGIIITSGTSDRKASVSHHWEIKKIVISVSSLDGEWDYVSRRDSNGQAYDVPVPKVMSQYGEQLELVYYSDAEFKNEVNLASVVVDPENGVDYYAKLTLKESASEEYEIDNVNNDDNYAWLTFTVGGGYRIIPVTISETNLIYTGYQQEIEVKSLGYTFDVTYYKGVDESSEPFGEGQYPINVGEYLVTIVCHEDSKKLPDTSRLILTINKLQVTVNGWTNGKDALDLPTVSLILSSNDTNITESFVKSLFKYEVYDETGTIKICEVDDETEKTEIEKNLNYNTNYKIKIVLTNSNVEFANENEIEKDFRTGYNPNQELDRIAKPTFVTSVMEWTGEDIIFEIADWNNVYSEFMEFVNGDLDKLKRNTVDNYSIELKIKDGANVIWVEDGTNSNVVLNYSIVKRTIDIPTFPREIRYTGEEINIFDLLAPTTNRWDLWLEIVSGNEKQTVVGNYTVKLKLNSKFAGSLKWADHLIPQSENGATPLYAVDYEWIDEELILTIHWDILPAQIKGEWKTENGYPTFIPKDITQKDMFKVVYKDENGNIVEKSNFVSGTKYLAEVTIASSTMAGNYEIASDQPNFATTNEFVYVTPASEQGTFEKTIDFVKKNWLYLVIALIVLILLIMALIIGKKRKKEKAELQKKLDEANSKSPYSQMPYPMPPYYPQMPPQYPSSYDSHLTREIDELRDEVRRLKKYDVASDEEKSENKQLARIEKMLMQFLMTNFANNPNWIPFNNQDMVNYDMNDLMKLYAQAKQIQERRIASGNQSQIINQPIQSTGMEVSNSKPHNDENQLIIEAEDFERKTNEYQKLKEKSQYEELLREVRELKADNKELRADNQKLKEQFETDKKERISKELEETKHELERQKLENESLKEKNQKHENEKLIDELVKKNENQIATKENSANIKVSNSVDKLEFNDAFNNLPANQKMYFNTLEEYALKQPKATSKPAKYHLTIGVGNSPYIKFVVKYNTLIACFNTTEIKIDSESSVEQAKQMIDKFVAQVQSKK